MTINLKPDAQAVVDHLLHGENDAERRAAAESLASFPDRADVETYLVDRLPAETDVWKRAWSLTALAKINSPHAVQVLLDHTAEANEPSYWARHFALLNAASVTPFPLVPIQNATQDADPLVKATALRILLAEGMDQYAGDLVAMLENLNVPVDRWAACRALRRRQELGMKELRAPIEAQIVQPMIAIARDPYVWTDARWEAVQALTTLGHHQSEAAKALAELLVQDKEDFQRRLALDALRKLNQPKESQEALLGALEDSDAEIRVRSSEALKEMIGAEPFIQLVITRALGRDENTRLLVDALRHIDPDLSAQHLSRALSNSDPRMSGHASNLITELGGQEATRILLNERTKALDTYTGLLGSADKDVMEQFKELMGQARTAFRMSLLMHGIVFVIGVFILWASLNLALSRGLDDFQKFVGTAGTVGGLATLLLTFYRNPLKNIRASVTELMKVNVVFLGYVRQINQVDATFKHLFLDAGGFGIQQMKSTVEEIQTAVKATLEEVQSHLPT